MSSKNYKTEDLLAFDEMIESIMTQAIPAEELLAMEKAEKSGYQAEMEDACAFGDSKGVYGATSLDEVKEEIKEEVKEEVVVEVKEEEMKEEEMKEEVVVEVKEEEVKEEEVKEEEKLVLPAYPDVLFELTDEQQEFYKYKGDPDDLNHRMRHKLWILWQSWYRLRNNEKLINLISNIEDKSNITYENMYFLSNEIVNTMDILGRVLSTTNITTELFNKPE